MHPEQGICPENKEAVRTHKQQVYLQHPAPVLINTWQSNQLPLKTRKRPPFKPPKKLHNVVVEQLSHETDDVQAYYQGIVTKVNTSNCVVQWTDGHQSRNPHAEIQSMLYVPISYAYDFLSL